MTDCVSASDVTIRDGDHDFNKAAIGLRAQLSM